MATSLAAVACRPARAAALRPQPAGQRATTQRPSQQPARPGLAARRGVAATAAVAGSSDADAGSSFLQQFKNLASLADAQPASTSGSGCCGGSGSAEGGAQEVRSWRRPGAQLCPLPPRSRRLSPGNAFRTALMLPCQRQPTHARIKQLLHIPGLLPRSLAAAAAAAVAAAAPPPPARRRRQP